MFTLPLPSHSQVAPALAAGNTIVMKPADYTPLSALLFAEVCAEAGLPPGVVNVVTGAGQTGAKVAAHPLGDKLAFTGSTGIGRILRRVTAGTGSSHPPSTTTPSTLSPCISACCVHVGLLTAEYEAPESPTRRHAFADTSPPPSPSSLASGAPQARSCRSSWAASRR